MSVAQPKPTKLKHTPKKPLTDLVVNKDGASFQFVERAFASAERVDMTSATKEELLQFLSRK